MFQNHGRETVVRHKSALHDKIERGALLVEGERRKHAVGVVYSKGRILFFLLYVGVDMGSVGGEDATTITLQSRASQFFLHGPLLWNNSDQAAKMIHNHGREKRLRDIKAFYKTSSRLLMREHAFRCSRLTNTTCSTKKSYEIMNPWFQL